MYFMSKSLDPHLFAGFIDLVEDLPADHHGKTGEFGHFKNICHRWIPGPR